MADNVRQALKRAQIGNDTHAGFSDAEDRILACDANVTGADQIDTAADAMAVNRSNHRLATFFYLSQSFLECHYFHTRNFPLISGFPAKQRSGFLQIGTSRKTFPFTFDDDCANGRVPVKLV